MKAFGKNLRRIRKQKSLTQAELAHGCGVAQSLVGHYETGTIEKPSWKFIVAAAKLMEVSIAELTGEPTYEEIQQTLKTKTTNETQLDYINTPFTPSDIRCAYRTGTIQDKQRIESAIYTLFSGKKSKIDETLKWLRE